MLKADKERLQKKYKELNYILPDNLINKLVTRNIILGYNSLFKEEWNILNDLNKNESLGVYQASRVEFERRWYVKHPEGWHIVDKLPSLYVEILSGNVESGTLNIKIDLKGPKEKIISEITSIVNTWHDEFERDNCTFLLPIKYCQKDYPPIYDKDVLVQDTLKNRLPGNVKKYDRLDDYELYLEVYAFKENGNSWSKIVEHFNLTSIDTARNHYRSAKRLIESGLPGFPPFPQK